MAKCREIHLDLILKRAKLILDKDVKGKLKKALRDLKVRYEGLNIKSQNFTYYLGRNEKCKYFGPPRKSEADKNSA